MYSIQKLSEILGYSEHQVRRRLDQFSEVLSDTIHRGAKNKILVDDSGLEILKRAKEIEENNKTISQALNRVKEELNSSKTELSKPVSTLNGNGNRGLASQSSGWRERAKLLQQQVEMLSQQFNNMRQDYKEQLKSKDQEIDRLHDIIRNRLPPPEKSRRKGESRFKKFLDFIRYVRTGEL